MVFAPRKRAEPGFLERKIFSMFKNECIVKLLKIVLYVDSDDCHIQEKEKELFRKEQPTERLQGLNTQ